MLADTIIDNVVLLIAGLGALIAGANLFVKSAGSIARRFGISELVIGLTLVSLGTSLPELVAAIIASVQGNGALTLGNVVGANIANLTIIIGSAAVLSTIAVQREMLERDSYLAILAALMLLVMALDGRIGPIDGGVLAMLFFAYTTFLIETSQTYEDAYHIRHFSRYFFRLRFLTGTVRGLRRTISRRDSQAANAKSPKTGFPIANSLWLICSLALIVVGGNFLVGEAVFLAEHFGLRVTLVGVILALGTAAPEMTVSVAAARQNLGGMVIGNAVGSVLTNTFLVMGVAAIIAPVPISAQALQFAIPFLILISVLLSVFKRSGMEIRRAEGFVLIALYLVFVISFALLG